MFLLKQHILHQRKDAANIHWKIIPNIGRDGDGITTFPVTASTQKINSTMPHFEYEFYTL